MSIIIKDTSRFTLHVESPIYFYSNPLKQSYPHIEDTSLHVASLAYMDFTLWYLATPLYNQDTL